MTHAEAIEIRSRQLSGWTIDAELTAQALKVIQGAAVTKRRLSASRLSPAELGRMSKPNRSEYAVASRLGAI